jgi:uncharacterized short protein YbdD (DUF466 family)
MAKRLILWCVERTLRPLQCCWRALRQLSGDDGYERYLAHHAAAHPGTDPLSRSAWFASRQRQKWSGVNRCC